MAQKGKLVVLSIETSTGPSVFTTIADARSNELTINGETVDITTKGSAGKRTLLEGVGIVSVSTSVSGVMTDSIGIGALRTAALNSTFVNAKIADEEGEYAGEFAVTSFATSGEYNGEQTFTASLESAGDVTYTAA